MYSINYHCVRSFYYIMAISHLPLLFLMAPDLGVWVSGCRGDATSPLQRLVKHCDVFLHFLQQRQKHMTFPHQSWTSFPHLSADAIAHETVTGI